MITLGGNVNGGGDAWIVEQTLVVLYPTSDKDALDAQAPLLDDRRIKSSHDRLYNTRQSSKRRRKKRDGYLPRQKRS
jgi:hypothetical protein